MKQKDRPQGKGPPQGDPHSACTRTSPERRQRSGELHMCSGPKAQVCMLLALATPLESKPSQPLSGEGETATHNRRPSQGRCSWETLLHKQVESWAGIEARSSVTKFTPQSECKCLWVSATSQKQGKKYSAQYIPLLCSHHSWP